MRCLPKIALLVAALALAGCDLVGMVGNPKTGFTVKFADKWKSQPVTIKLPDFAQQAQGFACELDRCGRYAWGAAVYGRIPDSMKLEPGKLPHRDDVVALVDRMLDLRGKLGSRQVNTYDIANTQGFRVRFVVPNNVGMNVLVRGNLVFHGSHFLFFSVATKVADETQGEQLLDEVAGTLRMPSAPGS